ncbi:MAG TPA: 2-aminoethylphosphonate ABC transporter permease subunit [Paraburkholderia sp.]|jgi:2-aminoethylphosphonate transport system permease protein|nr:2-aminoethylphosphonate ABC transporter permease subunit [Paraburkholderia sp.]
MSSLSSPDALGAGTRDAAADARRAATAASHAAAKRRRERAAQWHLLFLAVIVLGPLVVYPLVRLVLLSLGGDAHGLSLHAYATFFGNPETRGVIGTTLWILLLSAGLASLLGVALASLLFFKPFPGARLVTRFLELFVAFPSFLVAFTLIFLYGSQGSVSIGLQRLFHLQSPPLDFLFGIGGVILAEVVFYAPFVVRPTLASFALLDMRLIEAARSLGANGLMVALRVILPLAWPGIAAGTILCFLLTLNEFGILLVLGSAHLITLPVAIYSSATVDLDLPTAAAGAVVMLAMSLSLYALYRRVNRRKIGGAR